MRRFVAVSDIGNSINRSYFTSNSMSHLTNKSEMLSGAATLLNEKGFYPAVAHCAYYSCYQLSKHIWLYPMGKTQRDLDLLCSASKFGSHEVLINAVGTHIENSGKRECLSHVREFKKKIFQLKTLRTNADYDDSVFDYTKSYDAIRISGDISKILQKYR